MNSARDVALSVVRDVFAERPRGAQEAFDYRVGNAGLSERDRAFAAELAYGAIKMRRLLDWMLEPFLGERQKRLPPTIREIVRLGAYQLRFMGGVATHAAVAETVGLAKRHGHRGTTGLVNAVLRRLSEQPERTPERSAFSSDDDYLATLHSLPTWIVTAWRRRFGDVVLGAILAEVNRVQRLGIRVNALKASVSEVLATLEGLGARAAPSPTVADALLVEPGVSAFRLAAEARGRWALQSESACMPVDLLDPRAGEAVADLCSGRGNKTVQLASRMKDTGTIDAIDLDGRKGTALARAVEEAGAHNVRPIAGDARDRALAPHADRVLLDAPCSGLGILARHPEARWRKLPGDAQRLSLLQRDLLKAAATRLAAGGTLVYAVCSTDPQESEGVVDAFLEETPEFGRLAPPSRYAEFLRDDASVLVPPAVQGRDGFYIAALTRLR